MAAYSTPDLNDYLPGEPWTSAKALLVVENPIAFIEQDSTSPVNEAAYYPYDKVTVGDSGDGVIYDGAVDGTVNPIVSPSIDSGYRYLIEWRNLGGVTGPANVTINFYTSGAALIGTVNTSSSVGAGSIASGHLDFISDDYWRDADAATTKSVAVVGYFEITGVNFNAGKVYLRRRKELI